MIENLRKTVECYETLYKIAGEERDRLNKVLNLFNQVIQLYREKDGLADLIAQMKEIEVFSIFKGFH